MGDWDFFNPTKLFLTPAAAKPGQAKPTPPASPPPPTGTPDDDDGAASGGAGVQGMTPDRDREPSRARPAERAKMAQAQEPPRTFGYSTTIKNAGPDYPVQGNNQVRTPTPEPSREQTREPVPEPVRAKTTERPATREKPDRIQPQSEAQRYALTLAIETSRARSYRASSDPERQQDFSARLGLSPEDSQYVNKLARAPADRSQDKQLKAERDAARTERLAKQPEVQSQRKKLSDYQRGDSSEAGLDNPYRRGRTRERDFGMKM